MIYCYHHFADGHGVSHQEDGISGRQHRSDGAFSVDERTGCRVGLLINKLLAVQGKLRRHRRDISADKLQKRGRIPSYRYGSADVVFPEYRVLRAGVFHEEYGVFHEALDTYGQYMYIVVKNAEFAGAVVVTGVDKGVDSAFYAPAPVERGYAEKPLGFAAGGGVVHIVCSVYFFREPHAVKRG